jgi:hypothetical protein
LTLFIGNHCCFIYFSKRGWQPHMFLSLETFVPPGFFTRCILRGVNLSWISDS